MNVTGCELNGEQVMHVSCDKVMYSSVLAKIVMFFHIVVPASRCCTYRMLLMSAWAAAVRLVTTVTFLFGQNVSLV